MILDLTKNQLRTDKAVYPINMVSPKQLPVDNVVTKALRLNTKLKLEPGQATSVNINTGLNNHQEVLVEPLAKTPNSLLAKFDILPGLYNIKEDGKINVHVVNNTSERICLNKNMHICEASVDGVKELYSVEPQMDRSTKMWREDEIQMGPINQNEKSKLLNLINKYRTVMSTHPYDVGFSDLIPHTIPLSDEKPIRPPSYKIPFKYREDMQKEIDEMLRANLITRSHSSYAAPCLFVERKCGRKRLVFDYRYLNSKSISDSYPIPNINSLLARLHNKKIFSVLDLRRGYNQVKLADADQHKAAFSTGFGLYQPLVMTFGLKNASQSMQRLLDCVLHGLEQFDCYSYIDDILVASESVSEHFRSLELVFQRLHEFNLTVATQKCFFFKPEIKFLGYLLSENGLKPDPCNVTKARDFVRPTSVKKLKSFLGTANYYRGFIDNYAKLTTPLTNLTKDPKRRKFEWNDEAELSFIALKDKLLDSVTLSYPDFNSPFYIASDSSESTVAGVLQQKAGDGTFRPLGHYSRQLSKAEKSYSVTEKEALAVLNTLKFYDQIARGNKIYIISDHLPLKGLLTSKSYNCSSRLIRWRLALSVYDYEFIWVPGSKLGMPDFLSRELKDVNVIDVECDIAGVEDLKSNDFHNKLRIGQQNDPVIMEIKNILLNKPTKGMTKFKDGYFIQNDLVYHCAELKQSRFELVERVFVPQNMKHEFLEKIHNLWLGHAGVTKTYLKLREFAFWPNSRADVEAYIASCESCCARKSKQTKFKAPFERRVVPDETWSRVSLDLLGPYPRSEKGNVYILCAVCELSSYMLLVAIPDKRSQTVADALLNNIIRTMGPMKTVMTDHGTEFSGAPIKSICELFGIEHVRILRYRPESNSKNERKHADLLNSLSIFAEHDSRWCEGPLTFANIARNVIENSSMKENSYYYMFLREPKYPFEELEKPYDPNYYAFDDYFELQKARFHKCHKLAMRNNEQAIAKRQKLSQERGYHKKIEPGDLVFVYFPSFAKCNKLSMHNKGIYIVKEKLSPVTFLIQHTVDKRNIQKCHINRLTKITERPPHLQAPKQTSASDSEAQLKKDTAVDKNIPQEELDYYWEDEINPNTMHLHDENHTLPEQIYTTTQAPTDRGRPLGRQPRQKTQQTPDRESPLPAMSNRTRNNSGAADMNNESERPVTPLECVRNWRRQIADLIQQHSPTRQDRERGLLDVEQEQAAVTENVPPVPQNIPKPQIEETEHRSVRTKLKFPGQTSEQHTLPTQPIPSTSGLHLGDIPKTTTSASPTKHSTTSEQQDTLSNKQPTYKLRSRDVATIHLDDNVTANADTTTRKTMFGPQGPSDKIEHMLNWLHTKLSDPTPVPVENMTMLEKLCTIVEKSGLHAVIITTPDAAQTPNASSSEDPSNMHISRVNQN